MADRGRTEQTRIQELTWSRVRVSFAQINSASKSPKNFGGGDVRAYLSGCARREADPMSKNASKGLSAHPRRPAVPGATAGPRKGSHGVPDARTWRVAGWVRAHPLLAYVLLTYALSWAYWVPLVLSGYVVRPGSAATQFPALVAPMVAAVALTAVTRGSEGVRDLASRILRWRVPARWWLFAVGTPLVLLAVALIALALGPGLPGLGAFGRTAGLPHWGVLFVWAAFVVGGLGEEAGWRGYALPALRRRHGLLTSSMLLVPVWAGWHLPLFFLLQSYRDLGAVGVPGLLIGLACASIVLAWLYESASSSVLIAALWHGTFNLTSATDGAHGMVAAVATTGVMAGAVLLAWRLHRPTRALQEGPLG
jgi:membrane protease YdiL (CAAX protease family)